METKYFTCGVCGREFHESMGDTHPKSTDNIGVCCFCKRKMNNGLWPTKVLRNGRERWYVLWNVKRDVIEAFDNDYDLFDVDYIDGKRVTYHIPVTKENGAAFKNLVAKGGYIRSIHPLNKKMPVFHWGYHKLMWALIAKYNGRINPYKAWLILERMFPQVENIICDTPHKGFACPAAVGWDGETECKRCPLEWGGVKSKYEPPCRYQGSPYSVWGDVSTENLDRKHAARAMMYLPLSLRAESRCTIDD